MYPCSIAVWRFVACHTTCSSFVYTNTRVAQSSRPFRTSDSALLLLYQLMKVLSFSFAVNSSIDREKVQPPLHSGNRHEMKRRRLKLSPTSATAPQVALSWSFLRRSCPWLWRSVRAVSCNPCERPALAPDFRLFRRLMFARCRCCRLWSR